MLNRVCHILEMDHNAKYPGLDDRMGCAGHRLLGMGLRVSMYVAPLQHQDTREQYAELEGTSLHHIILIDSLPFIIIK